MPEFALSPEGHEVRIRAQAPGHAFEVVGAGLSGGFTLDGEVLTAARLGLELGSLSAGDRLRDHELRRFLELDQSPRAEAVLLEPLTLGRGTGGLRGRGRFRFVLGRRQAEAEVELSGEPGSARASFTLRFTALGFKPPRLLLLSVKDQLGVEVRLRAEEIGASGV